MCFESSGLLFNEFEQIFSDLFARRSPTYKKIVRHLATKEATLEEIAAALGREMPIFKLRLPIEKGVRSIISSKPSLALSMSARSNLPKGQSTGQSTPP
jgi:hypothetical protein